MSEDVAQDDVAGTSTPSAAQPSNGEPSRRVFAVASFALGSLVSLGPALVGLVAFLDPLFRKNKKPLLHRDGDGGAAAELTRIASLDALTVGMPQRFPVIDDQIDAWNFTPDQPIGAVYVEKLASGAVRVFNTTCPHAGCSVSCDGNSYNCPCHNSSFNLDGSKRTSESGRENPSPRDLDSLKHEIRDGDIWVEFKNFYTGIHDKKAKA